MSTNDKKILRAMYQVTGGTIDLISIIAPTHEPEVAARLKDLRNTLLNLYDGLMIATADAEINNGK